MQSLFLSILIMSLPFGVLDFVLPIYGHEIGASAFEIGLFFTVYSIMLVILRPLVGRGIDRLGRRPFLLIGLGGYAVTMFLFAAAKGVNGLIAARTLQGISSAFLWLAARSMIADTAQSDTRANSFGKLDQANYQGGILGTFPGFFVLIYFGIKTGWTMIFIAFGITSLIAWLLAFIRVPETRIANRAHQPQPIHWSSAWISLLLITFVTGAAWAMLSPILMIYLQEKFSIEIYFLALAYLPSAIIWAALPSRLGKLSDRFGRKPLMVISMLAAAATSFLFPHLKSLTGLALLWAFQALCFAAGDPAEQALVADLTGGDQMGHGFGLYTAAAGLGFALGPMIGGWLYDQYNYQAPFYINGALLFLSALILTLSLKTPQRTTATNKP
jgi:MFS family permease